MVKVNLKHFDVNVLSVSGSACQRMSISVFIIKYSTPQDNRLCTNFIKNEAKTEHIKSFLTEKCLQYPQLVSFLYSLLSFVKTLNSSFMAYHILPHRGLGI